MPKVRASSATIGTTRGPSAWSLSSAPSRRTKAIVVLISLPSASSANCAYAASSGTGTTSHAVSRRGTTPPSAWRCDLQVLHLRAVVGRLVERERGGLLVGQRQVEAVAETRCRSALVELLLAVRRHLALPGTAHAVALLGVRQDDGRLALVRRCRRIGGMDLHQVVAAALEPVDLLVGHALRQAGQLGVLAEEVLAVEAAVLGREGLHLAVDRVGEGARQRAGGVAREQAVPVAAPDQLDDVPAGAGEELLELVDDAAVAAHRAVQPLQVAVDDPDQVVELLACGQRQRAHRLGLVHLAVAEHAPDLAAGAVEQLPVREVAHEARVVDRADRPDAHRAGRELPEVGHQVGMRIAAQAACALTRRRQLLAVVQQVGLGQATFEEGARVHAGRAVRLEEHQVAAVALVARMEEVVEARPRTGRPRWRSSRCGRRARRRPGWRAPPSPARSSASATPGAPRSPGRRGTSGCSSTEMVLT